MGINQKQWAGAVGAVMGIRKPRKAKESAQHSHQQTQPAICPKCKHAIQVYYTGRSLCSNVRCNYEGPGIQQVGA